MSAVVRAAEQGIGVALVPSVLCDAWFRSGALVRIFPVELPTTDTYFLVSRPKDADKPEVKAITNWALSQFSST
jgi:DNA-binding transcriptional LysR family regulator